MTRLAAMLATVLSSSTLGTSAFVDLPKTVIWNASASVPIPVDDRARNVRRLMSARGVAVGSWFMLFSVE